MVSMNPLFSIAVLYFDLSVEIPLFDIKGFLSDPPCQLFVSFAKQLTTLNQNTTQQLKIMDSYLPY
jgi:hypothetical protein